MTTTVTFHCGDVRDVMAAMPDDSVDLVVTSPPFLALRSYLPADHPDKHREIGSEPTPAAFLDTLLELSAEWRRLVTASGSICVEIGDTYSGAGGYGSPDSVNPAYNAERFAERWDGRTAKRFKRKDDGWPLAKSLCMIPELYGVALAYGVNPLTGNPSPAGNWRVRNWLTWCRPNPSVGFLGDKFRPATSFVTVACTSDRRWFDLDSVRTNDGPGGNVTRRSSLNRGEPGYHTDDDRELKVLDNPAGAPPLDWWQDNEQPTFVTVACTSDRRWFDLDSVRTEFQGPRRFIENSYEDRKRDGADQSARGGGLTVRRNTHAGAPPLDWWQDNEQPTFVTVACTSDRRWFDLDSVRTDLKVPEATAAGWGGVNRESPNDRYRPGEPVPSNPAGAPPLDWWQNDDTPGWQPFHNMPTHPYKGSHYATYPVTLPKRLIESMCPREVCVVCGEPRRRIVETGERVRTCGRVDQSVWNPDLSKKMDADHIGSRWDHLVRDGFVPGHAISTITVGWSDCRCPCQVHEIAACTICHRFRPGVVLDPFAGSGTTGVAAALSGRDAVLIDIDRRNLDLCRQRLTETVRIVSEVVDGDTTTWTVDIAAPTELAAIKTGQTSLFDQEPA